MKIGDRVIVVDHSEAHNDHGTIYDITETANTKEKIYMVLLDEYMSLWPCELNQIVSE